MSLNDMLIVALNPHEQAHLPLNFIDVTYRKHILVRILGGAIKDWMEILHLNNISGI